MLEKEPLHYRDRATQSPYGRREHVFKEMRKKKRMCIMSKGMSVNDKVKNTVRAVKDFLLRHSKKFVSF